MIQGQTDKSQNLKFIELKKRLYLPFLEISRILPFHTFSSCKKSYQVLLVVIQYFGQYDCNLWKVCQIVRGALISSLGGC